MWGEGRTGNYLLFANICLFFVFFFSHFFIQWGFLLINVIHLPHPSQCVHVELGFGDWSLKYIRSKYDIMVKGILYYI